jgi:hypothetical protein
VNWRSKDRVNRRPIENRAGNSRRLHLSNASIRNPISHAADFGRIFPKKDLTSRIHLSCKDLTLDNKCPRGILEYAKGAPKLPKLPKPSSNAQIFR